MAFFSRVGARKCLMLARGGAVLFAACFVVAPCAAESAKQVPPPGEAGPDPSLPPREVTRDDAASKPDSASRALSKRPAVFEIVAGAMGFSRSFTYVQDINANLRPYSLALAPAGFFALEWYPGAHLGRGALAAFGLVGDVSHSVATSSVVDRAHPAYMTSLQSFSAGLRGRIEVGASEIGLSMRGGQEGFALSGDAEPGSTIASGASIPRSYVPNVRYTYVRPGIDARLRFGDFGVGVGLGYRYVVSAGEIQTTPWFPSSTVTAGDATLFVSLALGFGFEARVGGEVHRYAFDMHSKPTDLATRDVAGGAVDQYVAATLALAWRAPGR